ncbi:hypothetical protein PR048_002930 [Dryococelus australis]|uniref:Uncharacterized protein n=1 Tax=Dryococelus australis TaxID=614101 RepID=A0ABQ9ILN3_9NEOP|nr:hypothetical protein PR048_002930 [Dryococelus australis]
MLELQSKYFQIQDGVLTMKL